MVGVSVAAHGSRSVTPPSPTTAKAGLAARDAASTTPATIAGLQIRVIHNIVLLPCAEIDLKSWHRAIAAYAIDSLPEHRCSLAGKKLDARANTPTSMGTKRENCSALGRGRIAIRSTPAQNTLAVYGLIP